VFKSKEDEFRYRLQEKIRRTKWKNYLKTYMSI
jgi:hypothetical protein